MIFQIPYFFTTKSQKDDHIVKLKHEGEEKKAGAAYEELILQALSSFLDIVDMHNISNLYSRLACALLVLFTLSPTAHTARVILRKGGQISFGDSSHYNVDLRDTLGHLIKDCGCTNIIYADGSHTQHLCARIEWEGDETIHFHDMPDCQLDDLGFSLKGKAGDIHMNSCGSFTMNAKSIRIESSACSKHNRTRNRG